MINYVERPIINFKTYLAIIEAGLSENLLGHVGQCACAKQPAAHTQTHSHVNAHTHTHHTHPYMRTNIHRHAHTHRTRTHTHTPQTGTYAHNIHSRVYRRV